MNGTPHVPDCCTLLNTSYAPTISCFSSSVSGSENDQVWYRGWHSPTLCGRLMPEELRHDAHFRNVAQAPRGGQNAGVCSGHWLTQVLGLGKEVVPIRLYHCRFARITISVAGIHLRYVPSKYLLIGVATHRIAGPEPCTTPASVHALGE